MLTLLLLAFIVESPAAANPFADLSAYNGAWTITSPHTMAGTGKTDALVNQCASYKTYYACEQVVNGKPMALIVFVLGETPGTFHSQPILPDGHAVGRGDLTIAGSHWTFNGKDTNGDKTTWYRTENYFTGRDRIRFEMYQSSDGKTWEMKNSGDEVRQPIPSAAR